MLREFFVYAWRGSISRAGAWAPLPGTILIWLALRSFGRTDVMLPTTLLGAVEFFLACASATNRKRSFHEESAADNREPRTGFAGKAAYTVATAV